MNLQLAQAQSLHLLDRERGTGMRVVVMALVALALTLGSGFAALAGDDEATIRAITKEFAAGFNKGDAKAVAALYDTEATWTDARGNTSRGRDAIEERCAGWFAGMYKGASIELTMEKIRFLRPDVAVGESTWAVSGMTAPDGKPLPPAKGRALNTIVKKDGKWLLAAAQSMVPVPPAPSTEKK